MARGNIKVLVADMRSDYLKIAVALLYLAQELLETVAQSGTLREPERKAGTYIGRECKQLHLFAYLAMVAFLGLFEHHEILIEHLFLGEGDAIDANKLVAFFVATPVCTCKRKDFHSLDWCSSRKVRTTTQVGERALCICGDVAVLKLGYKLALIFLATVTEHLQGIVLRDVCTHDRLFFLGQLNHLGFDSGEVGRCDGVAIGIDVVVEAILNGRTDTELYARIQFLKSFGEQVGRRVPESVLAFGIVPLEQLYLGIFGYGA